MSFRSLTITVIFFFISFSFANNQSTLTFFNNKILKEKELSVSSYGHSFYKYHNDNNKVVLLIHGYTSNPTETKALADFLFENGFDVYGVRMHGHGTTPQDLKDTNWRQWHESAESVVKVLKNDYKAVHVFGVSLGAINALHIAADYDISSIVVAGAPVYPADMRITFGALLYPITYILNMDLGYLDVPIPKHRQHITHIRNPIRSSMELWDYSKYIQRRMYDVDDPLLILHCANDDVASPQSARFIDALAKSKQKQLIWIGNEHSFLIDYNEEAFNYILKFYQKNS